MSYIVVLLMLSCYISSFKCEENPSDFVHEVGDVTFRCVRSFQDLNMNLHCDFTDHRNPSPSCPERSVIPRFKKISIECPFKMDFLYKRVGCKITEIVGDGSGEQKKDVFHLNATVFLSNVEHNTIVYDTLMSFESILSLGEAFMRCRTQGPWDSELSCSFLSIEDKASAEGNFSCSLMSSSPTDDMRVNVIQCGFRKDHMSAKNRGNMTIFARFYKEESMSADILFAVQSSSPANFIMETQRLNCRMLENDINNLSCGIFLNEAQSCDDPACCESHPSRKDDVKSQEETQPERDLWELDQTWEMDIEDVGVARAKFICHVAIDIMAYAVKCSYRVAEGTFDAEHKIIVGVETDQSEVSTKSAQLTIGNVTGGHSFQIFVLNSCNFRNDGSRNSFTCAIRLGKEIAGYLRCNFKDGVNTDGLVEYPLLCTLNLQYEFCFEGKYVTDIRDPNVYKFDLIGDLKRVEGDETALPVTSSCSASLKEKLKATCRIDYGGHFKLRGLFNPM